MLVFFKTRHTFCKFSVSTYVDLETGLASLCATYDRRIVAQEDRPIRGAHHDFSTSEGVDAYWRDSVWCSDGSMSRIESLERLHRSIAAGRAVEPMFESHVPNLDDMDRDDVLAFQVRHAGGENASELFGDATPLHVDAAANLARYAYYKGDAMRMRGDGNITYALVSEAAAQLIYDALPQFARW